MRRLFLACLAASLLSFPFTQAKNECAAVDLAYAIFLRVNGRPITQDNVAQAVRFLVKREYNDTPPADLEEHENIQKAAIRDLVRSHLIHSEATRLNIKLDRGFSRRAVAISGLRPDEVTPTIRRILEADDLFEEIMMAEGTPIREPSPKEVKDFYINNRDSFRTDAYVIVRTIFIGDDGSQAQSYFKDRATEVMHRILEMPVSQRADAFAKAAREYSQDIFAEFGGLLTGSSPEHWMPQEFTNQNPNGEPIFPQPMIEGIRRLKTPGEIRLAVSEDGMHLLYLEDIRGGSVIPWGEAKRIIDFHLKQVKRNTAMRDWINRVYDRSDVRWHNGTAFEKELLTEILLPSERGTQQRR